MTEEKRDDLRLGEHVRALAGPLCGRCGPIERVDSPGAAYRYGVRMTSGPLWWFDAEEIERVSPGAEDERGEQSR